MRFFRRLGRGLSAAASEPIVLHGKIERVVFRANEGFTIASLRLVESEGASTSSEPITLSSARPFTLRKGRGEGESLKAAEVLAEVAEARPHVGPMALSTWSEGDEVMVSGIWRTHPKYGKQLEVVAAIRAGAGGGSGTSSTTEAPLAPELVPSSDAVVALLSGAREFKGIGPKLAQRIVDRFGPEEALSIFENGRFSELQVVSGISARMISRLSASAGEAGGPVRDARAALLFARVHNIPPAWTERLRTAYGSWEAACGVLRQAPYRIVADVPGIGFKAADRLAAAMASETGEHISPTGEEMSKLNVVASGSVEAAPQGSAKRAAAPEAWWAWWMGSENVVDGKEGAGGEDEDSARLRAAVNAVVMDGSREGHCCMSEVWVAARVLQLIWVSEAKRGRRGSSSSSTTLPPSARTPSSSSYLALPPDDPGLEDDLKGLAQIAHKLGNDEPAKLAAELMRIRQAIRTHVRHDRGGAVIVEPRIPLVGQSPSPVRDCYVPHLRVTEVGIARRLAEITAEWCIRGESGGEEAERKKEETVEDVERELTKEQARAVQRAVDCPVSVVTGGPGSGKTAVAAATVRRWRRMGLRVAVACPTARAAARVNETLQQDGGDGEHSTPLATTLHRLLGFGSGGFGGGGIGGTIAGTAAASIGEVDVRGGAMARALDDVMGGGGGGGEGMRGRPGFARHEGNPLDDLDALLVDESSMVDAPLLRALLRAIPSRSGDRSNPPFRIVFVGDADQLPSIGPGRCLADLITSGAIPVTRLGRIFRQDHDSAVLRNAASVNAGKPPRALWAFPSPADVLDPPSSVPKRRKRGQWPGAFPAGASLLDSPHNCVVVNVAGSGIRDSRKAAEAAGARIATDVLATVEHLGIDPEKSMQVLTPVHRGPLGTVHLNRLLQHTFQSKERLRGTDALKALALEDEMGREGPRASFMEASTALANTHESLHFLPGDRVMQVSNNYTAGVVNGEQGVLVSRPEEGVSPSICLDAATGDPAPLPTTSSSSQSSPYLWVKYSAAESAGGERYVRYSPELAKEQLQHAYAVTVHKAQGSEHDVVVAVLLHPAHFTLLSRGLLYTALARAKRLCVLVTTLPTLTVAINRDWDSKRRTGLASKIQQEVGTSFVHSLRSPDPTVTRNARALLQTINSPLATAAFSAQHEGPISSTPSSATTTPVEHNIVDLGSEVADLLDTRPSTAPSPSLQLNPVPLDARTSAVATSLEHLLLAAERVHHGRSVEEEEEEEEEKRGEGGRGEGDVEVDVEFDDDDDDDYGDGDDGLLSDFLGVRPTPTTESERS